MTIKVSIAKVLDATPALQALAAKPFRASLTLKLVKVLVDLNKRLEAFQQVRNDKIKQYGAADEKGEIRVLPENIQAFSDEIEPLVNEEVELPFDFISIDSLDEKEKASFGDSDLSAQQLLLLSWLIG